MKTRWVSHKVLQGTPKRIHVSQLAITLKNMNIGSLLWPHILSEYRIPNQSIKNSTWPKLRDLPAQRWRIIQATLPTPNSLSHNKYSRNIYRQPKVTNICFRNSLWLVVSPQAQKSLLWIRRIHWLWEDPTLTQNLSCSRMVWSLAKSKEFLLSLTMDQLMQVISHFYSIKVNIWSHKSSKIWQPPRVWNAWCRTWNRLRKKIRDISVAIIMDKIWVKWIDAIRLSTQGQ